MKIKKVLIIDDEEDFGMLMERFFTQKKYEVFVAYTIEDGMKILDEQIPDVIFLDNNLPDGSGIESIPLIRSQNSRIKIIVISAMSNLREKALNFQADAFIDKPISFENIRKLI